MATTPSSATGRETPSRSKPTTGATPTSENAIRDLKYGVGLNHLPSGRFAAGAAWLAFQVMAHNLGLWLNLIGLQGAPLRMKTLRQRYLSLPGRLTRSARRRRLSLPCAWPWREEFMAALERLRSLPLLA